MTEENNAKLAKIMEQNIKTYINLIDPCYLCENKGERYSQICLQCCFYYPCFFEIKKIKSMNETKLKEQIEKMKCCENCKHRKYDRFSLLYCELENKSKTCSNKDLWELAE